MSAAALDRLFAPRPTTAPLFRPPLPRAAVGTKPPAEPPSNAAYRALVRARLAQQRGGA